MPLPCPARRALRPQGPPDRQPVLGPPIEGRPGLTRRPRRRDSSCTSCPRTHPNPTLTSWSTPTSNAACRTPTRPGTRPNSPPKPAGPSTADNASPASCAVISAAGTSPTSPTSEPHEFLINRAESPDIKLPWTDPQGIHSLPAPYALSAARPEPHTKQYAVARQTHPSKS